MKYKLLVILGAAGALGYLFRKQLQTFVEDRTEDFEGLKADIAARVVTLQAEKESKDV